MISAPGIMPDVVDEVGVGLSDAQVSMMRRKLLDLINRLQATGVQKDLDLPMIAVIGFQSAGKSSLLESISAIRFPRAHGTCTRCPTECTLSYSEGPWTCTITLRFDTDDKGQPVPVRNVPFGNPIQNKSEVEERLRRAQRAILNPSVDPTHFLASDDVNPTTMEKTFSYNCICVKITGKSVADLSFCDLPGLISTEAGGTTKGDVELIRDLAVSYIKKPSCIILLTISCETDFANQGAHHLTKQYDQDGQRTIGVLTKPDRIPPGEEDEWLKFIKNQEEALEHGWFSVKQPGSQALQRGISWAEARQEEREWFSSTPPWAGVNLSLQRHFGTANLIERCSDVLSNLIGKRLPEIQSELQDMLQRTDGSLRELPKPPSSDPLGEVLTMLAQFSSALGEYLEGTPDPDGLIQSIKPLREEFRKAIRATAPDFRPYDRTPGGKENEKDRRFVVPGFLSNEESEFRPANDSSAIYIDDVLDRAARAVTRELPGYTPFIVTQQYIQDVIAEWDTPSLRLYDTMQHILLEKVKTFIGIHFKQYPQLQQRVASIVSGHILQCADNTREHISWVLELEKRPHTLNEHYYRDYREKFLAHFKGLRPKYENTSLTKQLKKYNPAKARDDDPLHQSVSKIMEGFAGLGIHGISPVDLPRVLPSDPYESAIEIMASVRAYFQVSYKRFADMIPAAIDYDLVLGLKRGYALEKALRKGLEIGSANADDKCAQYLQEPATISEKRSELAKKRERLVSAKKELMELWL